jgi:hypothetical protein
MKKLIAITVMALAFLASAFAATTNSTQYGFSVTTPMALTQAAPTARTTNSGVSYTETIFSGAKANGDAFLVGVGTYPFTVGGDSPQRATDAFAAGLGGTVSKTRSLTISGQPGLASIITLPTVDGKTQRFGYVVTYKGNHVYQFVFATFAETESNMTEVEEFFNSITIN